MYDSIIENGTVLDGRGSLAKQMDIGLRDDGTIVAMGDLSGESSMHRYDATGQIVLPGFIDILNHSDAYWTLFTIPTLDSLLRQGITTIALGNCGSSLAPLIRPDAIDSVQKWTNRSDIHISWSRLRELNALLTKRGIPVNIVHLLGHSTIRRGLVQDLVRELSADELRSMERVIEDGFAEGARGVSVGLSYAHAHFVPTEELLFLAKIVKRHGGLFSMHLRNEGEDVIAAVDEAVRIARESGARVEIAHFKVEGKAYWDNFDHAWRAIKSAREEGIDIGVDVYPYTKLFTTLHQFLPMWATRGGRGALLENVRGKVTSKKLMQEMQESNLAYAAMRVAIAPRTQSIVGKTFAEIALRQGTTVERAVLNVVLSAEGNVIVMKDSVDPETLDVIIRDPASVIATDAAGYDTDTASTGNLVHPRSFATMIRFLKNHASVLGWPEAVKKVTSEPARRLGLSDRGTLEVGKKADVVVLDLNSISENADFDHPYLYPSGVQAVFINGRVVLQKGQLIDVQAGEIIGAS